MEGLLISEEVPLKLKIPENLTQQAFRLIRNEILQGRLNGEQRVTEEYFASRLGISKSPIREALNRLEAEGLIRIVPRRGAFLVDFSVRDVEEIYELREILECSVVRNLNLDSKTAARLHAVVDSAEAYLKRNDKVNYVREDAAFHTILAQANSNSRIRKVLEQMHSQMLILRYRTFELSSRTSVTQHRSILNALEKGRQEIAAKLMRDHIRTVRKKLLAHLTKTDGSAVAAASVDRSADYN